MKIMAYGTGYFGNPWHRFDFIIVLGSWSGFLFSYLGPKYAPNGTSWVSK